MAKQVLVIGGTRFFGIRLVHRLLDAGHRVAIATRGITPDRFGDAVRRIVVDRRDLAAMTAAFADERDYDVVYDQMCYSARDAEISAAVLGGRVGHYVMASTIEVYQPCYGRVRRPFAEADAELDAAYAGLAIPAYAAGKRAAEAALASAPALPGARVRIGHVLGGPEDFTGRLASYVERVCAGAALRHSANAAPTSFIGVEAICALLCWIGERGIRGPINAASHAWSAVELHHRVAAALGRPARTEAVAADPLDAPGALSAFDYAAPYAMTTAHAAELGYAFPTDERWLDDAIDRHVAARAA
jgi:nucleoside-diphosphate-sugar epimerase